MKDISEKLLEMSVDWSKKGNVNYRQFKMCDLQWATFIIGSEKYNSEFEIAGSLVACACNGGPIAVMNRKGNFLSGGTHLLKDHVGIFNACGKLIDKIMWKEKGDVVRMEYTSEEVLVIVTSDGHINMIRPKEEGVVIVRDISSKIGNSLIEGAKVHETSLILITSARQVFLIKDLTECSPEVVCEKYCEERTITSSIIEEIAIIDASVSASKEMEIVFPHQDSGLYRITPDEVKVLNALGEKPITFEKVTHLAISPPNAGEKKGQYLALYMENEDILVTECNLESGKALKYTTDEGPPEAVVWCGADTAALVYMDRVILPGPNGTKAEFSVESYKGFYCYPEVDGIRILANGCCWFIERVPQVVESTFTPASLDPAAHILNAYQKYLESDPRAEDTLKSIKEDNKASLAEGIKTLIKCATYEFVPEHQKYILKAASFAKNFISPGEFSAEEFVQTLKHLRIVNQLHVQKYGRMMTYSQYKKLKTKQFIRILMRYHHHFLSYEIYNTLNMEDKSVIYEDWAIQKLKFSRGELEEKLFEDIKKKLGECSNLSYKKIAMAAEKEGRKEIALSLLKNEDSIKDQVPILLTMKEYVPALSIAVANCEADIVYGIFSEMRKKGVTIVDIVVASGAVDGAISYLISYAIQRRSVNPSDSMLSDISEIARKLDPRNPTHVDLTKKFNLVGMGDIEEIDTLVDTLHVPVIKEYDKRINLLLTKTVKTTYVRIKPYLDSEINFMLFKGQQAIAMKKKGADLGDNFLRAEGALNAIMMLSEKPANTVIGEAMAKKLNIDKKQHTLVKLRAAAKVNDWASFMDIMKKDKPKITPQFCAQTCIEFNNKDLAINFIKQIPSIEDKISFLLDIDAHREAIEAAVLSKKQELLDEIQARVKFDIQPHVQDVLAKMKK